MQWTSDWSVRYLEPTTLLSTKMWYEINYYLYEFIKTSNSNKTLSLINISIQLYINDEAMNIYLTFQSCT